MCVAYEYNFGDKNIDVAFIEIKGRYPEKGRSVNEICKEIAFVSEGRGFVEIEGKRFDLDEGDSFLIQLNQRFFWKGEMKIVVCCNPSWNPEQYNYCD